LLFFFKGTFASKRAGTEKNPTGNLKERSPGKKEGGISYS